MRIEVMTHPFGQNNDEPRRILEDSGFDISYNESGGRLRKDEIAVRAMLADGIIAGTEQYADTLIAECRKLKVISRVGVGVDNVDLERCDKLDIAVTWTPEAPADGVAELTISHILGLLRHTYKADRGIRDGVWKRHTGSLIHNKQIGVLGVGRIGKRVINLLRAFTDNTIYGCDLEPDHAFGLASNYDVLWLPISELFTSCDLVTIHVPMNEQNYHLVGQNELGLMRVGGFLVNTSRGPIVDEGAVLGMLQNTYLAGYAADVYSKEPYFGPLADHANTILSAHMGSCTEESRYLMEVRAAEDCVRVLQGEEPLRPVPMELRKK